MAESTLSLGYVQFMNAVCRYLGWGDDYTSAASAQQSICEDVVRSGLSQFYMPIPIDGRIHVWGFIKPITTITVWGDSTSTLNGAPSLVTGVISGTHTAITTLTVTASIFTAGMIGQAITIDTGGTPVSATIIGVTSGTVCTLDTAITESDTDLISIDASTVNLDTVILYDSAVGKNLSILNVDDNTSTVSGAHDATTTLTIADAIFTQSMVGYVITIDTVANVITAFYSTTSIELSSAITEAGGETVAISVPNLYEILEVTNSQVCIVSGIATAEADAAAVTLTANGNYRLPDDCGNIEGPLTFEPNEGWTPIKVVGESQIRDKRQTDTSTNRPSIAAVRPLSTVGLKGQRFELMLFPEPNGMYVLSYQYIPLYNKLSTTSPYPIGGAYHGETILESCLAVAEQRENDEKGIHWDRFIERLRASIAFDSQAFKAQSLGLNLDRSESRYRTIDRTDGYAEHVGEL